MQGWQWRQPDHAQRENSKGLFSSKTQHGVLDAVGRHLQRWLYLQSCWAVMAGFLLNVSQASWASAINEQAEDPNGALVRLNSTHSLFFLQPQGVVTGCWKTLRSWGCPQKKGGAQESMRLYSLCTAASGRALNLSVPLSIRKVKMILHISERCMEATSACNVAAGAE